MYLRTAALFVIVAAGCAGPQKMPQVDSLTRSNTGLYVGHSTEGQVVLAANHYDAMSGLATTADELGIPAGNRDDKAMLCQREMPTGTHVPHWICRYQKDVISSRMATRDWLDTPRLSFSNGMAPTAMFGRGSGGGNRGTVTP